MRPSGRTKEIKEVSADLEEGREAEVDFDGIVAHRRGGDERGLEEPGLAHVVLTDEAAGWRLLCGVASASVSGRMAIGFKACLSSGNVIGRR